MQLSLSIDGDDIAWDTGHEDIVGGHAELAKACDQGMAALIIDLKARGLFEDTPLVWRGELGRTPTSEGAKARDHDHYGYTNWLAGGGAKPAFSELVTSPEGINTLQGGGGGNDGRSP